MNSLIAVFNETIAPMADVPRIEIVTLCEDDKCLNLATSEWKTVDNWDGSLYYTYRCADHAMTDPEFVEEVL